MPHYALKFAYDGTYFFGYQRQPNRPTVEDTILAALKKLGIIKDIHVAGFRSASRTDRGVSALGNVISFRTSFKREKLLDALNHEVRSTSGQARPEGAHDASLDHIWFYGLAEVNEEFNPRRAYERWYRYYLPLCLLRREKPEGILNSGELLDKLRAVANIFVGEHDFSLFSRPEGRSPIRTIRSIKLEKAREFVIFDFRAESFLWGQVRRIVGAIVGCMNDEVSPETLERALEPQDKKVEAHRNELKRLHPARPEFLILMDVSYKRLKFEHRSPNKKLYSRLESRVCEAAVKTEFFKNLVSGISHP